jgi:FtsP/CotA-like multicopper oxidase with cupredoxin domain
MRKSYQVWLPIFLACLLTVAANAQSFRVQCPTSTPLHSATSGAPGGIKCQQISGGDGYATMADGTQTYLFAFGPLSGLADIRNGLPGTQTAAVFNTLGDPINDPTFNGAVGLTGDPDVAAGISGGAMAVATVAGGLVTAVTVTNPGSGYIGPPMVTFSAPTSPGGIAAQGTASVAGGVVTTVTATFTGLGYTSAPTVTIGPASSACAGAHPPSQCLTGHVDPRVIMDVGVMNGNMPAPLIAFDEDDEFFLTLTNVGMIMRPDLFEQHTVHFHGYPNASSFYDGVPDASVAINIGGSFTYYYLAPDAGTYFWHCHITPPEHLQMGMVGQLYVRPRQNRVIGSLSAGLVAQQTDLRTASNCTADILCSSPAPRFDTGATGGGKYAYNDGDGTTRYDVEYPIQIHGFDPNFHFVGMTFNPEGFADIKDKYFLLNGRSYPDTITPGAMQTPSADGVMHFSQPLPTIINIPAGGRALLRISDLDVSEYQTLASLGIPMQVIALNARLLRDQAGNNLYYNTNSITLAGGESLDVILDSCGARGPGPGFVCMNPVPSGTYYLYTPNLDHLSNDAENFGGLMTEVHVN